jgi:serine/threonine protein kinase
MEQVWEWTRQLISALYTIHVEAKLVHRDIKPDNIMLNKKDDITLVDFGVSKKFTGDDDIVEGNRGTVLFFAPEIVRTGQVKKIIHGCKTDIWAAGVTLFIMATGHHPFES